jgi:cobalamin-dependent methionine synthase I
MTTTLSKMNLNVMPPKPPYTLNIITNKLQSYNERINRINTFMPENVRNDNIKYELLAIIFECKDYHNDMEKYEPKNFDIKVQIVSLCFNVNALYEKIFDKNRDTFWLTDEETDEMKKIFRKNYKGIMNL